MEFFKLVDIRTSEKKIQEKLRLENLEDNHRIPSGQG